MNIGYGIGGVEYGVWGTSSMSGISNLLRVAAQSTR